MSPHLSAVNPGDVLAVRTRSRIFGPLIRLGEALAGRPHHDDHVVIVHHWDVAGTLWGIEGRPGGVGWVDVHTYDNPQLLSNAAQPKSSRQRDGVCAVAEGMLGVDYDWAAIGVDAEISLGLEHLWRLRDFGEATPGHVVCSSLAAWVYRKVGLRGPVGRMVTCTPGDWAQFMIGAGWR